MIARSTPSADESLAEVGERIRSAAPIRGDPDKPDNEPGYDVEEDVAWCVAPLDRQLPMPDVEMFRGVIRMLITEPLADRRPLIQKLAELSGE